MIQFKSIRANLSFWFLIIAIVPPIIGSTTIYNHIVKSRKVSIYNKLEAIRDLKVEELNHWIDARIADIRIVTSDHGIRRLELIHRR